MIVIALTGNVWRTRRSDALVILNGAWPPNASTASRWSRREKPFAARVALGRLLARFGLFDQSAQQAWQQPGSIAASMPMRKSCTFRASSGSPSHSKSSALPVVRPRLSRLGLFQHAVDRPDEGRGGDIHIKDVGPGQNRADKAWVATRWPSPSMPINSINDIERGLG